MIELDCVERDSRAVWLTLTLVSLLACSDAGSAAKVVSGTPTKPKHAAASDAGKDAGALPSPGLSVLDERVIIQTPAVELAPGDDKLLCYAVDLDEDVAIASYTSSTPDSLQRVMLARALTREPDGLTECNAFYRTRWQTLFFASKSAHEFALPEGYAQKIAAGSQLVAAFELQNDGPKRVAEGVTLELTRTHADGLRSLGTYVLGTADLRIGAQATGHAEVTCKVALPVELVAVLPELHGRGTAVTLETGASKDALSPAFSRDPFRLMQQQIEPLSLTLPVGELARVACDYDNPDAQDVGYREGPDGEMCFLLGFAAERDGVSNCLTDGAIPSPGTAAARDAGASCDAPATDAGVGAHCTSRGGECPRGLRCTADFGSQPGVCTRLGCANDDECGAGASCCKLLVGGISLCLQQECLPATCLP